MAVEEIPPAIFRLNRYITKYIYDKPVNLAIFPRKKLRSNVNPYTFEYTNHNTKKQQ